MTFKKLNIIVAAALFLAVLAVYLMTVAPTISFWDTGEFITCAVTMGIPHPPGAPLLSIAGRFMSIIPFYDFRGSGLEHIAYRINILSVLAAALTVLLLYLVIVRLVGKILRKELTAGNGWPLLFAAALASFMAAFSHQFWENAIETETYMPSIFLSMLALWLVMKWEERKNDPPAVRYLFLAGYLIGLGNGVHLYVMLMLPAAALIVYFARPDWFGDSRFRIAVIVMLMAFALLRLFGGKLVFTMLMGLSAVAGPYVLHRMYIAESARWKLSLIGVLACLALFTVGYSVYPTVMIRAGKTPAINEGNPDNWQRYRDYLERKQYLQENMYSGMFTRKAPLRYQFGFMYARYLFQQFPKWGPSPALTFSNDRSANSPGQQVDIRHKVYIPLFLWLILLFGVGLHALKDPKRFSALLLYFLATSAGLVLYLNMANPEVRERDYFFLGSFLIVHVWLGIGAWAVLSGIGELIEKKLAGKAKTPVMVIVSLLLVSMAPAALLSNHIDPDYSQYGSHDRSGDLIPLEYGTNILTSCEENAVLFTHGDNDTYPVWYAQEVLGFRKDIRVVNVSLLNAPWYAVQLRDEGVKLPIELDDEFLAENVFGNSRSAEENLRWKPEARKVTMAGITWDMPPSYTYPRQDGSTAAYLNVSAWMTAYIINQVNWSRPVYFAATMGKEALIGLEPYLALEGMVFHLTQTRVEGEGHAIAREKLEENMFGRYRFTGISDPNVYKAPETHRLIQNYFVGYGELVKLYLISGETEKAIEVTEKALNESSPDLDHRVALFSIIHDGGLTDKASEYMRGELSKVDYSSFHSTLNIGMIFIRYGFFDAAATLFRTLTETYTDNLLAWKAYSAALYGAERFDECLGIIEKILTIAPGDQEALMYRKIIQQKMNGSGS